MLLLYVLLGILALILLVAYFHLDTFISFVIVSIGLGLACGMEVTAISQSLEKGIGGTLGSLVIIIGFGSMLGKLVADSVCLNITTAHDAFWVKIPTAGAWHGRLHRWTALVLQCGFVIVIPYFYHCSFDAFYRCCTWQFPCCQLYP